MFQDGFDLKDPRNVSFKYKHFQALIMFAWEEGDQTPSALAVTLNSPESTDYANLHRVERNWDSFDQAVSRGKTYVEELAKPNPRR
jgi:geranylgeranyl pyrophosphate synthase